MALKTPKLEQYKGRPKGTTYTSMAAFVALKGRPTKLCISNVGRGFSPTWRCKRPLKQCICRPKGTTYTRRVAFVALKGRPTLARSEERRVGKECRARRAT